MSKSINIESNDFDFVNLAVKNGEQTVTYTLVYDYAAIKRAEDATGIDLKDFTQWKNVKSQHMPALVYAGLQRHHSDITLEEVAGFLNPGTQAAVQDAVFELMFPGVIDKVREAAAKDAERKNVQRDAQQVESVPANG